MAVVWPQHLAAIELRPRLIVLTDFFKDPDDKQSLIRLLTYANEFEIEGLIATSLAYGDGSVHPERIRDTIDHYEEVLPNLQRNAPPGRPFPSAESLRQVVRGGAPVIRKWVGRRRGFPVPFPRGARDSRSCEPAEHWIGEGKDTDAARLIVDVVDRDDPRPVWVIVWGGSMDLAQAVWTVRHTRSSAEADRFISKLRVYQIGWQDTGTVWLWENEPQLFRIQARDVYRGIYHEGPPEYRDAVWVEKNIRTGHGVLGAQYPEANIAGVKEGDTPSFLYLLAPGLSDPEHPEWGGWGGRFVRLDRDRRFYVDAEDNHPHSDQPERRRRWTLGRWNEQISRDFAARMDWCTNTPDANHHPLIELDGDSTFDVVRCQAISGEEVTFTARASDPDGDEIDYLWERYAEADSYAGHVALTGNREAQVRFVTPAVDSKVTIHLILTVTDRGVPSLSSYRRAIVTVRPGSGA